MNLKKTILAASMAFTLALGSFGTAFADSEYASWDVTFDKDKKMVSTYDQQEINNDINAMMPGDDLTLNVDIKNDCANGTEWYMTSTVLQTLEDANIASGGAYTYRLSYNGTDIYDSQNVGGDTNQGLREVDDATGSWIYLGTLEPGQGGNVQLYLKLDGATQENNYMRQSGGLQINFAVEDTITPNRLVVGGDLPQTGDTMMSFVMFGICAVLVLLTAMSFFRDRMKANSVAANATATRKHTHIRKGGDR